MNNIKINLNRKKLCSAEVLSFQRFDKILSLYYEYKLKSELKRKVKPPAKTPH